MKKLIYLTLLTFIFQGIAPVFAANDKDEKLGLPGDNLNLYAVMDLFQNSETLEGFERELNNPENLINNLDLNEDNEVDYIFVNDYPKDNIHQIVMQIALDKDEMQDVGVFVVEKQKDGAVQIQLIGDDALYGENYIIEPNYDETPNPGYNGNISRDTNNETVTIVRTTYVEVAQWPVIVYIGSPDYYGWRSGWHYGYYPSYWSPWRPFYWDYYYGYHYHSHRHYHAYYRHYDHPRCHNYRDDYYTHHRRQSNRVVVNVNNGRYKETYRKPEMRRDGEAYYAKRAAENHNLPGRRAPRDERKTNKPGELQRHERPSNDRGRENDFDNRKDDRSNKDRAVERPVNRDAAPKKDKNSRTEREDKAKRSDDKRSTQGVSNQRETRTSTPAREVKPRNEAPRKAEQSTNVNKPATKPNREVRQENTKREKPETRTATNSRDKKDNGSKPKEEKKEKRSDRK